MVTPDPPRPQTQSGKQAAPDKKTEEQSKTPLAAPKEATPNEECRQSSRKDLEKKNGSRSGSPTRLMFDMVNHMFHLQNTMRNIHHELQVQTDILRSIRDSSAR